MGFGVNTWGQRYFFRRYGFAICINIKQANLPRLVVKAESKQYEKTKTIWQIENSSLDEGLLRFLYFSLSFKFTTFKMHFCIGFGNFVKFWGYVNCVSVSEICVYVCNCTCMCIIIPIVVGPCRIAWCGQINDKCVCATTFFVKSFCAISFDVTLEEISIKTVTT